MNNTSLQLRRLTLSALFLALALVLPFLIGQIPQIGQALSPMHIPVFVCGFLGGWPWWMGVGLAAPYLCARLFGLWLLFRCAVSMAFELAVYGLVTGLLHPVFFAKAGRKPALQMLSLYATLLIAMVAGRLVWGAARLILAGLSGSAFAWKAFLDGALLTAIPGIILHLALVPILVFALERAGLSLNRAEAGKGGRG